MARSQESQRQRTQNNPLILGSFDTTTIKYLKGRLGPLNQLVGYADTNQQSNGGFGGGTYNHWFQINLKKSGWIIIVTKAGPKVKLIQASVYDLNQNPINGRAIFQEDSVTTDNNGKPFYPYFGTVMGAQSDLYDTYMPGRLDKGDERYYPLEDGSYLLCISTVRNELVDYEVGIVIEFPAFQISMALEDEDEVALFLQETQIDFARTIDVISPVVSNITISSIPQQPNGFTEELCAVNSGVTVTVLAGSEWFIGTQLPLAQAPEFTINAEPGNDLYFDSIHDHSLSEWEASWESTHQDSDKFPVILIPCTNRR